MILDNLIELYSIVLFSVEGDHSLTIDPELVAFACSNQNYSSLAHNDQVRLSSIRLEVLRIGIGIRRQTLMFELETSSRIILNKHRRLLIFNESQGSLASFASQHSQQNQMLLQLTAVTSIVDHVFMIASI